MKRLLLVLALLLPSPAMAVLDGSDSMEIVGSESDYSSTEDPSSSEVSSEETLAEPLAPCTEQSEDAASCTCATDVVVPVCAQLEETPQDAVDQ